jgi:hypothetical protein
LHHSPVKICDTSDTANSTLLTRLACRITTTL